MLCDCGAAYGEISVSTVGMTARAKLSCTICGGQRLESFRVTMREAAATGESMTETTILVCDCGNTREVEGAVAALAQFTCSSCTAEIYARHEAEIVAREQRAEARYLVEQRRIAKRAKKATAKTAKAKKRKTKSLQDVTEAKTKKPQRFNSKRELREYVRAKLTEIQQRESHEMEKGI